MINLKLGFPASLLSLMLLASALAPWSLANVSLKNGNFFRGYTDIAYQGGFEPKVDRVYNSKTNYSGIFGLGWGSEYEARLAVSADGSVVLHEYGGGAENRFVPSELKAQDLEDAVKRISDAVKDSGRFGTQKLFDEYRQKLRSDSMFRNDEWQLLVDAGRLKPRPIPAGTKLVSNRFSYQTLTKTADGYQRVYENGKLEKFNEKGKLVRIQDKNANFIDFTYGKDGRLQKLIDNFNRKMFFTFNSAGLLERIQGEDGKEARYTYTPGAELAESRDVEGNVYKYKYSTDGQHNLVEVAYSDKSTMQVDYYGRDKFGSVKSVKERDGSRAEYNYEFDARDSGRMVVTVSSKGADGSAGVVSRYEYFNKTKPDGEEWTQRMITTVDGDRTETVYNECCGLPVIIKRGSEETTFVYDSKGRVTRKVTPTETTELSYDPRAGKVSRVVRTSKSDKKQTSWAEFQYDDRGNLSVAKNSLKRGVKLFYDANGRIKSLLDQDQRRLDFKYNENSKPIEISDPKLGAIRVTYKNSGDIDKIDSSAGQKVAVQVTTAFQNLLEIIRPAGVNLSF